MIKFSLKKSKLIFGFFIIFFTLWQGACTSQPHERFPGNYTLHFPLNLLVHKDAILASSGSTDNKYSYSRIFSLEKNIVGREIKAGRNSPVDPEVAVQSNALAPNENGNFVVMDEYIWFYNNEVGKIFSQPFNNGALACNGSMQHVEECSDVTTYDLENNYEATVLKGLQSGGKSYAALGYLGDRIDIFEFDRASNQITLKKSENIKSLLNSLDDLVKSRDPRLKTLAMQVINKGKVDAKVLLLVEAVHKKSLSGTLAQGVFILEALVSDLVSSSSLSTSKVKFYDLQQLNISSALDFYVDNNKIAFVLGREPNKLYKINLKGPTLKLNGAHSVCQENASALGASEDHDRVFVACYREGSVHSFSMTSFDEESASELNQVRGAASIAVDSKEKKVYVASYLGGTVHIFDFNLRWLGKIFSEAPLNREGS